ncbi:MAG TPA: hypothetical protein VHB73_07750 [Alphaproteobacteria bacterium]|nr:hypothetical protein [Alphaproteobacteria bacterium]
MQPPAIQPKSPELGVCLGESFRPPLSASEAPSVTRGFSPFAHWLMRKMEWLVWIIIVLMGIFYVHLS